MTTMEKSDFTFTQEHSPFTDHVKATGNLAEAALRTLEQETHDDFLNFIHHYRADAQEMPSEDALTIMADQTVVARDGKQYAFIWQDHTQNPPQMVTRHAGTPPQQPNRELWLSEGTYLATPLPTEPLYQNQIPKPRFQGKPITKSMNHADLIHSMLLNAEREAAHETGALYPGVEDDPGLTYDVTDVIRQVPELLQAVRRATQDGTKTYEHMESKAYSRACEELERLDPQALERAEKLVLELAKDYMEDLGQYRRP